MRLLILILIAQAGYSNAYRDQVILNSKSYKGLHQKLKMIDQLELAKNNCEEEKTNKKIPINCYKKVKIKQELNIHKRVEAELKALEAQCLNVKTLDKAVKIIGGLGISKKCQNHITKLNKYWEYANYK